MTKPKKPTRKAKTKPRPINPVELQAACEAIEVTPQVGEHTLIVGQQGAYNLGRADGHKHGLREGRIETILWILIITFIGFLLKGALGW